MKLSITFESCDGNFQFDIHPIDTTNRGGVGSDRTLEGAVRKLADMVPRIIERTLTEAQAEKEVPSDSQTCGMAANAASSEPATSGLAVDYPSGFEHAGLRYSPSKPASAAEFWAIWAAKKWKRVPDADLYFPRYAIEFAEAYRAQAGAGWVLYSERPPEPSGDVKLFCYSRAIGQVPEDFDVAYYDPGHSPLYPWYVPSEGGWCHKARYTHWMKASPPEEPRA